jgi:ATP-dependent DNA helicase RecG
MDREKKIIPSTESLKIEFKSDQKRLPDRDLIAAVVCLSNTEGGEIYLGVEKNGEVSGLHPEHQNLSGLTALIANRTIPPVSVRIESIDIGEKRIAKISVPKSRRLVSTSEGLLQRRRLMADGTPECVPFYPHEFARRESDLGLLDYSALPVNHTTPNDIDPLERQRLRQMIERYSGDRSLLALSDQELDGALGFIRREDEKTLLTVAGLLILGKEAVIRERMPSHEVAFQLLEGTQVRVNDFYRTPLLKTFERVQEQFESRIVEEEIQVGLFRVPVPTFDKRAFREALVNALTHRDYTRLGACHVRWETDGLIISSPGGFVEGVTLENLLVVEPKPRNPYLADAFKRIGLAERTGRGVDLIFQGLLRYGRPEPDYSRSNTNQVVVRFSSAVADLDFLRMILDIEERTNTPIPIDSLIVLSRLRRERRMDIQILASAIQKDDSSTRNVIERLMEIGLVEAHGIKKGRTYTLSAKVYRRLDEKAGYIRQAGFDPIQQEQMVLRYVHKHGSIRRKDAIDLCQIGPFQATRLLKKLEKNKDIKMIGSGRGSYYSLANGKKRAK